MKQRKLLCYCSQNYRAYSKIHASTLAFLMSGSEKKRHGTHVSNSAGQWGETTEDMLLNLVESGHPTFRSPSVEEED